MKRLSKKISVLLGAIFLSCTIIGCGNDSTGGDPGPSQTPELSSISLSGDYQTSFTVGDAFSHVGVVVTAHYTLDMQVLARQE